MILINFIQCKLTTYTSHLELPLGHLMALCCSIYRHSCYGKHSLRIAPEWCAQHM